MLAIFFKTLLLHLKTMHISQFSTSLGHSYCIPHQALFHLYYSHEQPPVTFDRSHMEPSIEGIEATALLWCADTTYLYLTIFSSLHIGPDGCILDQGHKLFGPYGSNEFIIDKIGCNHSTICRPHHVCIVWHETIWPFGGFNQIKLSMKHWVQIGKYILLPAETNPTFFKIKIALIGIKNLLSPH